MKPPGGDSGGRFPLESGIDGAEGTPVGWGDPMSTGCETAIRQAATVVLARDGEGGIEVFLLLRNARSAFAGDCYVFPGGALEEYDRHPGVAAICRGPTDEEASARLGVEKGGLAYWHAAMRECFEESGLLLAVDERGEFFSADGPATVARFASYRKAVYGGTLRLMDICRQEGLRLAADKLDYFSHWITPKGAPRRYDTRFFVGLAPPCQEALHDNGETVAHTWIRPEDALDRYANGEFKLMRPTIATLKTISGIPSTGDLISMVQGRGEHPCGPSRGLTPP